MKVVRQGCDGCEARVGKGCEGCEARVVTAVRLGLCEDCEAEARVVTAVRLGL